MLSVTVLLASFSFVAQSRISVAYYTAESIFAGYAPDQIPFYSITHLNYAFAAVDRNGTVSIGDIQAAEIYNGPSGSTAPAETCAINGNLGALWKLRQQNPHLRVMLSIGGYGAEIASAFTVAAQSEFTRSVFANASVALVQRYGFDGLDVDWEFIYTEDDGNNLVLLLKAIRAKLNELTEQDGKKYAISIAAPAILPLIQLMPVKDVADNVDWMNLLNYDMSTDLAVTYHDSALYQSTEFPLEGANYKNINGQSVSGDLAVRNQQAAINAYLDAGAPASKVIMGIPLYGYKFDQVEVNFEPTDPNAKALLQSFKGNLATNQTAPIAIAWKDILITLGSGSPYDWRRFRDETAMASYVWNPYTKQVIVYMDASQATPNVPIQGKTQASSDLDAKLNFVIDQKLGGVMFWQLRQDAALPTQSVVYQSAQRLFPNNAIQRLKFPVCAPLSSLCNIKSECSGSFQGADNTSGASAFMVSSLSFSLALLVVHIV